MLQWTSTLWYYVKDRGVELVGQTFVQLIIHTLESTMLIYRSSQILWFTLHSWNPVFQNPLKDVIGLQQLPAFTISVGFSRYRNWLPGNAAKVSLYCLLFYVFMACVAVAYSACACAPWKSKPGSAWTKCLDWRSGGRWQVGGSRDIGCSATMGLPDLTVENHLESQGLFIVPFTKRVLFNTDYPKHPIAIQSLEDSRLKTLNSWCWKVMGDPIYVLSRQSLCGWAYQNPGNPSLVLVR